MKGYTDFLAGFLGPEAIATKPIGKAKCFNWAKAKEIIKKRLDEEPDIVEISIGLMEDWNNTSGVVYRKGIFEPDVYVFDHSIWATPIIDIDGEEIECWTYENREPEYGDPRWLAEQFGQHD